MGTTSLKVKKQQKKNIKCLHTGPVVSSKCLCAMHPAPTLRQEFVCDVSGVCACDLERGSRGE